MGNLNRKFSVIKMECIWTLYSKTDLAYTLSWASLLSSISTLFHSFGSGAPRGALFFFLPNAFSGSCLAPKTTSSTSSQDTVMRVSPFTFFCPFVFLEGYDTAGSLASCDSAGEGLLPSSNAMKASEMRRSTLPGAWLGLLCRHRSEQYLIGVDAALVVCDFRVPLWELSAPVADSVRF